MLYVPGTYTSLDYSYPLQRDCLKVTNSKHFHCDGLRLRKAKSTHCIDKCWSWLGKCIHPNSWWMRAGGCTYTAGLIYDKTVVTVSATTTTAASTSPLATPSYCTVDRKWKKLFGLFFFIWFLLVSSSFEWLSLGICRKIFLLSDVSQKGSTDSGW